jgi:hypothetical protein
MAANYIDHLKILRGRCSGNTLAVDLQDFLGKGLDLLELRKKSLKNVGSGSTFLRWLSF